MANKRPDKRSRKIVKDRTGRCHGAGGLFVACEGEGGSVGGGTGEASAPQPSSSSQPARPLNQERFTQVSRETRHLDPDTRHAHHTAAIKKIEGDAQARATGTRTAPQLSTQEQETIDAHRAILTTVEDQQHKRRTNEIAWRKEEIHNRAKQRGMDKHLTDDDRQSLSEAHATLSTLRTVAQQSPTGELGSEHLQQQRQARTTIATIAQKHARAKPVYTRSDRERLQHLDAAEKNPSIPLQSREAATLSQQRREGERRRLTQAEATAAQRQGTTHHPSHDIPIVAVKGRFVSTFTL